MGTDAMEGKLYLGREYDQDSGAVTDQPVLYDPRHLTTHAVILGMTGSGKTGLGVVILEEALLQRLPVLIIDPKGDITNMLLTFPELQPAETLWVHVDEPIANNHFETLAELGVIFLMFMIGLEISVERLWSMRRQVFGLGGLQVALTAAAVGALAWRFGNGIEQAKAIIDAGPEELASVHGIGEKTAQGIWDLARRPYR